MVGAWKIDENTDDLQRLRHMFEIGLNNTQIAKIYRTRSGHTLSRPYIKEIRSGKKWNPDKRSFLMKTEIQQTKQLKNYYTLRLWDEEELKNVVEITPQQLLKMKEQITNIFTNESGGITIIIDVSL